MIDFAIIGGVVMAGSVLILSYAVFRMRSRVRRASIDASPAVNPLKGGFSLDRYRPMERLLSPSDFEFLRGAPGYTPELGARWKKQQARLFKLYLMELRRDFRLMHAEARSIIANTQAESPEIVRALVAQRIQFEYAAFRLEMGIRMAQCGLGNVSAGRMIGLVERMQKELEILVPRPMPMLVS